MPSFAYQGRDKSLARVSGSIEADSEASVVRVLTERGIAVTNVTPERRTALTAIAPDNSAPAAFWSRPVGRAISEVEVILFSRQMYSLSRADVPILRAMMGLQESSKNPNFAALLSEIRQSIEQGKELSTALAEHPKVFSPFYISMVRVGELSGRLAEVFDRLYGQLEFEREVRAQIRAALRYPVFVLAAVIAALAVINIFVIPAFSAAFASMNAQLPQLTRFLIAASDLTLRNWPFLLGGVVVGAFAFRSWKSTAAGRITWDRIKLGSPMLGEILQMAALSRFARAFALASRSGVPVLHALSAVATTVDNAYIAMKIDDMRDSIERGESLYRSAVASGVFTPVVLQMLSVGEESGELDGLLTEVATMYERETSYAIKELSARIEPLLMAVMAGIVLVVALGVFVPMWSIGQAAMGR